MPADTSMPKGRIPRYEDFAAGFTARQVEAELSGDLDRGLNACIECCDRHAHSDRIALFWEGRDGNSATLTFAELRAQSARMANFLASRGVEAGDRVAGLLPRIPELLVVILGTWRVGAVYQPLFTAFGPTAIEHRLTQAMPG